MLKLDVRMARQSFFDRKVVRDAVDRGRQRALVKSAALVYTVARRSMRYRKWRPGAKGAPPGRPPFARTGRGARLDALVRKGMAFVYDRAAKSAVVGPLRLAGGGTGAPSNLEFGGTARARDARTARRVGGSGEIRVSSGTGRDSKGRYTSAGGRSTKVVRTSTGKRVRVTYAKLKTAEQAARATRLNDELYRPASASVRVAARPFMAPALRQAAPSMPSHWKNTVRAA